jgi:serine/threonine-protein kinase HipA
VFLLGQEQAVAIVNHQVNVIEDKWKAVCDEAGLSEVDRALLWRRQFLNPFAFFDAPQGVRVPGLG